MKANELSCIDLMIGDFVFGCIETDVVGEATYKILCKVKNINYYGDCDCEVIEPFPDELDWQDGDDFSWIEPIPLTNEILEKNGFEYYHKNFASLSYDHQFKLEMEKWPDENGLGGLWSITDLIKIRYVHELQHALRLCGIEKEIVL